jgi:hypothetical protein
VTRRQRALLLMGAGLAIGGGAIIGFEYYRSWQLADLGRVLQRLPTAYATVLHVDVAALRKSRVLDQFAASNAVEEPEYRAFVSRTGFDYKKDLDGATVAFAPEGVFFILKGRFDWSALKSYVDRERGSCRSGLCEMTGSKPDRIISFLPLRSGVMGMAVSSSPGAAALLRKESDRRRDVAPPDEPLWVSFPPSSLKELDRLPAGTRSFARAMQTAEQVLVSIGGDDGKLQANLLVDCRSASDAQTLAAHLSKTTELLRSMIERENQTPNPSDLSGVLTSGVFRQEGTRVRGTWPLGPGFLENMLSGRGGD